MDIERLKEMKEVLNHSIFYFGRKSGKTKFADTWFDVMKFIDEAIARQSVKSDMGETSDGYHTFNELYEHRTALFATLCNMRSDISWKSMKHDDGTMYEGMFIAGIETPDGQYTYHCEMKYWYMFAMTKEIEKAPAYDGHQPSDYPRLLALSENSLYRQSELEVVTCPDCNGSGVYQEYDEYDRYYVHACGTCDGSGTVRVRLIDNKKERIE